MDVMITSPILQDDSGNMGSAGDAGAGVGGNAGGLNFDPNMDPELAEAIRLSMEEANAAANRNPEPEPAAQD